MLVSPTEPHIIQQLGKLSWLPEARGVDVCWRARGAWWGVQRKRFDDFVASIIGGRLSKEIAQMKGGGGTDGVILPVLVLEGVVRWTGDGELVGWDRINITRDQTEGRLFSLAMDGVHVFHTKDTLETKAFIERLERWSRKAKHSSSSLRPNPIVPWGSAGNRDWALHVLQSFPGVGVDRAAAVLDAFGRVPMQWDVSEEEMAMVKGLGKKTVRGMYGAFESEGEK